MERSDGGKGPAWLHLVKGDPGRKESRPSLPAEGPAQGRTVPPRSLIYYSQHDKGDLKKAGIFSLLFHVVLLVSIALSLKPTKISEMSVYQVKLRPYAPPGAIRSANPGGGPGRAAASTPAEKVKPGKASKGTEIAEKVKPDRKAEKEVLQLVKKQKASERKAEEITGLKSPDKKSEKLEREKINGDSLQEALDEIRRKAALDDIQKRLARRGAIPSQVTTSGISSPSGTSGTAGSSTGSGSGSGAGTGSGVGVGPGTGGYPMAGVPWGSPQGTSAGNSRLDDYSSMIWAKVKQEWTLPELPKEKMDLEAVIVVVIARDGRVQKSWFEKKSGNGLYDQMAMRAIKKADPFPPIPAEFSDKTFEIGIRFHPE